MIQLKLTASTPSEQRILEYLQNNASETLAEKINNGTPFEKDGKPLTNKKSLSGFMEYACGEARNLAAKGETAACVEDSVVYGWAIHYFEEDSIEGTLYTLDGSEYIPEKKSAHVSRQTAKTSVVSATTPVVSTPQNKQESLFDMLSSKQPVPEPTPSDEPTPEELQEALEETANEPVQETVTEPPKPSNLSPVYAEYLKIKENYPDCIVAYRLGDFYEILDSDAVTVANELDLTLTSRNCGLDIPHLKYNDKFLLNSFSHIQFSQFQWFYSPRSPYNTKRNYLSPHGAPLCLKPTHYSMRVPFPEKPGSYRCFQKFFFPNPLRHFYYKDLLLCI